ncbi:MAG TPA: hypothetical protein VIY86_09835, partial [Pirellulaceae bacterium]
MNKATPTLERGPRPIQGRSQRIWLVVAIVIEVIWLGILAWLAIQATRGNAFAQDPDASIAADEKSMVQEAYLATYQGWSSDEVLLQDELQRTFLAACRERDPRIPAARCNWLLLNLRKAGQLPGDVTRRRDDATGEFQHIAEIAARFVQDKRGLNTDRVLCDPTARAEFDALALEIAPDVDPYLVRKAALGLRKARRLRPELIIRVADWGRRVAEFPASELHQHPDRIPELPGVYIFRDATGYLYVGEALHLRSRLVSHLRQSDRESLAGYLAEQGLETSSITVEIHSFPADSRARESM